MMKIAASYYSLKLVHDHIILFVSRCYHVFDVALSFILNETSKVNVIVVLFETVTLSSLKSD
jgi:hypothetical protein